MANKVRVWKGEGTITILGVLYFYRSDYLVCVQLGDFVEKDRSFLKTGGESGPWIV